MLVAYLLALNLPTHVRSPKIGELLDSWAGKSFRQLPSQSKSQFQKFVNGHLLRARDKGGFIGITDLDFNDQDGFVWKFSTTPKKSFLIYLNPHNGMVPSAERAWLFIVDGDGTILRRADFDTGWRMYANGATYSKVDWISKPVLIQTMVAGVNGHGPRKIYIGFDGLRPAVVRIEDDKGAVRKMDYFDSYHVVGPKIQSTTKPSMLRALLGNNEVRRLEALVWLSGDFIDRFSDFKDLTKADATRHTQLVKDKDISNALKTLRESPNSYVKQLAQAVNLP